jgi:hypothetical protein
MGTDVEMPGDGQYMKQIAAPSQEKLSSRIGADQKRKGGVQAVDLTTRRARMKVIGRNFWHLYRWEDDGGAFVFSMPFRNVPRGQAPGRPRVIGSELP